MHPTSPEQTPASSQSYDYDLESQQAGWDSPRRIQEHVARYLQPGCTVLDIGIGTGLAIAGYAEKGINIVGIDIDPNMLNQARTVAGQQADLRQADINETLPIPDLQAKVDVVQAVGVLEFVEDLEQLFQQVTTTLRPDGVFAFTIEESTNGSDVQVVNYQEVGVTVYARSAEAVTALVEQAGMRVLEDEAYEGYVRDQTRGERVPYHLFLVQKANPETSSQ
jgi:predicted TPR repeat methyltransferase